MSSCNVFRLKVYVKSSGWNFF